MGGIRPNQPFFRNTGFKLKSIELNHHYGRTKFSDNIWVTTLEGNFSFGSKTMLQFRLPYVQIRGRMGGTAGIGDLSLSLTHTLYSGENQRFAIVLGTRLPSNDGNRENSDNRQVLPSYYQTSMGTVDAVVGVSWLNKDWLIATGLQHPFAKNRNNFLYGVWDNTDMADIARQYPLAQEIHRGSDWMLRVERKVRLGRWTTHLGLLGIYRLNEDEVKINEDNQRMKVSGTNGLASNAILGIGYALNVHTHFKFLLGKKINERRVMLDGLQREYIAQMSFEWRF